LFWQFNLSYSLPLCPLQPQRSMRFIQDQWNVVGAGGWSHLVLDAPAHRLYISRANRIMVVDAETGKVAGEVEGMTSARGIALDGVGKFGYVSDLTDGTAEFVRVFDRSTLKLVASIPTCADPRPSSSRQPATRSSPSIHAATAQRSLTLQPIRSSQLSLYARDPLMRSSIATGTVFVTIPSQAVIVRIDAASMKITASFPLAPCTGPNGLTIDKKQHQLMTTCEDHKLVAINTDTGLVSSIGVVPAGTGDIDFVPKLNSPSMSAYGGEYGASITELYQRLVNLDVVPGFSAVAPVLASNPTGALTGQTYPASLLRPDRLGIEPRIGISWRPIPGSSVVVRAGYGIYDDTSVYQATVLPSSRRSRRV
jgi:hypothetical protein